MSQYTADMVTDPGKLKCDTLIASNAAAACSSRGFTVYVEGIFMLFPAQAPPWCSVVYTIMQSAINLYCCCFSACERY